MRNLVGAILVSMLAPILGWPALAADLPVPQRAKPERVAPVQEPNEFDKLGADCIEASDGCRRFTRASDGKYDAANNIGIACQPKALSCTKRK